MTKVFEITAFDVTGACEGVMAGRLAIPSCVKYEKPEELLLFLDESRYLNLPGLASVALETGELAVRYDDCGFTVADQEGFALVSGDEIAEY